MLCFSLSGKQIFPEFFVNVGNRCHAAVALAADLDVRYRVHEELKAALCTTRRYPQADFRIVTTWHTTKISALSLFHLPDLGCSDPYSNLRFT